MAAKKTVTTANKATDTTKAKAKVNVKVKKSQAKVGVVKDKQTRVEIMQRIAEENSLTRVQVESVFDSLVRLIEAHIKKRGSGEFTIPKTGIKIRRVRKKATKSRKMVSPLTGEEVTINAKPARYSVKLSALKTLREIPEK